MSSFLGGRSGNRGRCAQPCRKPYEGEFLMNMRDLCALPLLPRLLEAGASSLKIEGRMKSPLYTYGVVSVYRRVLDRLAAGEKAEVRQEDMDFLSSLFDRGGFTDGYFSRHNGPEMIALENKKIKIGLGEAEKERLGAEALAADPVSVTGTALLRVGKPAELILEKESIRVTVQGEEVQQAANRPLAADQVRKQLLKTGESDFCFSDLQVETDGDGFMPLSRLNELRRNGLECLKETVLASFRRDGAAALPGTQTVLPPEDERQLNVLLGRREQLEAVLAEASVDGVYIPADYIPPEELGGFSRRIHEAGKKCYYALPFVFRQAEKDVWNSVAAQAAVREAGIDGVLVRNLDELAFWKKMNLPGRVIADAGLYSWNREAAAFYYRQGADRVTCPLEVHEKDLPRHFGPREFVVYGRAPLMISAQCPEKTQGRCRKMRGQPALSDAAFSSITDRTGAVFVCETRCRSCYSLILNSVPTWLGDLPHPNCSLRIQLSDESAQETARLLRGVGAALRAGGQPSLPEDIAFTRGNYRRGVE